MNRIEEIFQEKPDIQSFAGGYLGYLSEILATIDPGTIASFTKVLLEARDRGARIFFIGNGGSAATASHFANDLSIGTRSWQKPFQAISLTDNVPILTAIANDYSYDDVFLNQLKAQMRSGDVLVAISVSGQSPNVLRAVEYANRYGAVTVSLTGFDGGRLKSLCKVSLHAETHQGEYGPVEDIHLILNHLVGTFLMLLERSEENKNL